MAPELILLILSVNEELPSHSTKESDVYAFGMVAVEVLHTLWPNPSKNSPSLLYVSFVGVHRLRPIPLVPA